MPAPRPLYTAETIHVAYQLNWSVTLFWRDPITSDEWLVPLREATESDGVRILEHQFAAPDISRFLVSTKPGVAPPAMLRSLKGRLQVLVRAVRPRAFQRHYDVHSLGQARRETVETYLAGQVEHHPMADPRVTKSLERNQIEQGDVEGVDLSAMRSSGHGRFRYSLHLVMGRTERHREIREEKLAIAREGILRISRERGMLLSRAGVLPDHLHLLVGCPWEMSPLEVALCIMNNLAWMHGMKPIFEPGAYLGTVGEYDRNAVRKTRPEAL